jgi:hypothetical protein
MADVPNQMKRDRTRCDESGKQTEHRWPPDGKLPTGLNDLFIFFHGVTLAAATNSPSHLFHEAATMNLVRTYWTCDSQAHTNADTVDAFIARPPDHLHHEQPGCQNVAANHRIA